MSTFEDYNSTYQSYDKQRIPVGADVIAALVNFYGEKTLKKVHILDAGCGTGNYAKALLNYGVGAITLLDASSGMLSAAKSKMTDEIASGRVKEVKEAKLPHLPFEDNSFDVVMINVVLHHLDNDQGRFTKAFKTIEEVRRVLKKGGLLLMTTQSATTLRSIWYANLVPSITERYIKKWPSLDLCRQMFDQAGLLLMQQLNLIGCVLQHDYDDLEGPLFESWRQSDSYWSVATDDEISQVETLIQDLKARGQLEAFKQKHDNVRNTGLVTLFVCKAE